MRHGGCVDVTSLSDAQLIETDHIAALLASYRCPVNFAIWNGAGGNSVIIRTRVARGENDMLAFHRGSPERVVVIGQLAQVGP